MMKYVLLALTWAIVLSINIYLLVNDNMTPIVWLWVILAGLSIIPIAERLKIGDWLDFNKTAKHDQRKYSQKSEDRVRISNINILVQSEEAAQAFVRSRQLEYLADYQEDEIIGIIPDETEETEKTTIPVIKAVKAKEINRLYFLSAANETIAGVIPMLHTIYSTIIAKRYDRLAEWEELPKDILSIIEEVTQYAPQVYTFEDSDKEFKKHLTPVKHLIALRNDVRDKKADPPPIKIASKLFQEVGMTAGFLTGIVSTGLSMLVRGYILNSINIKKWGKETSNKQENGKQNHESSK